MHTFIGPAGTDLALMNVGEKWLLEREFKVPDLDLEGKMDTIQIAVVGAHLEGMPLHWQLTSRNAQFVGVNKTAKSYRLYAMANSTPPKPALVYDETGVQIALEIYSLTASDFGTFTAQVPPPLAIGSVTLEDGSIVKGFVAEPRALIGALDISDFGGWRAYIASLAP
jgi:allophanate hydrolase